MQLTAATWIRVRGSHCNYLIFHYIISAWVASSVFPSCLISMTIMIGMVPPPLVSNFGPGIRETMSWILFHNRRKKYIFREKMGRRWHICVLPHPIHYYPQPESSKKEQGKAKGMTFEDSRIQSISLLRETCSLDWLVWRNNASNEPWALPIPFTLAHPLISPITMATWALYVLNIQKDWEVRATTKNTLKSTLTYNFLWSGKTETWSHQLHYFSTFRMITTSQLFKHHFTTPRNRRALLHNRGIQTKIQYFFESLGINVRDASNDEQMHMRAATHARQKKPSLSKDDDWLERKRKCLIKITTKKCFSELQDEIVGACKHWPWLVQTSS